MSALVAKLNAGARRVPTWLIYMGGVAHIVWLFYLAQSGALGAEPINALERVLGETGLKLLIAGLAITPLLKRTRLNLVRFRRALGLTAFLYVFMHLTVWLVLDVSLLSEISKEILRRPYITVGMAGFVALVPLALTSNSWSIRRLGGAGWRKLHKLTYLAVLLGGVHFVMIGKTWQAESLTYMAVIAVLLLLRLPLAKPRRRQDSRIGA
ncbi:protein-methionine-sulfoxide reductase heme-binding subunit MsrQ [Rhodobacteraceae bacterium D3-12]|nr:protein-methionine-sulfoxide reductase heme-binding subunit MsrQ [Rhodobacteraceae bacterium D3-12]